MKAILMHEFGGPEVLKITDIDEPVPNAAEILVEVHAASVNPADAKVRAEGGYGNYNVTFPYILGRDFSGVVKSCGADVADFKPGDEVFGVLAAGIEGTYTEALVIDAAIAAKKPAGMSHVEAAALALTGLTALTSLEDAAGLKRAERILIHGGAGGVGSYAVQLAHTIGAEVITTASPANHDYLKSLGADRVIDYNSVDFTEIVSDCDVVFDLIGGEVNQSSFEVMKPGGRMIYIAPLLPGATPPRDDVQVIRPNVSRDRPHLERVAELFNAGDVIPPDIAIMPLADAGAAHEKIDGKHVRGKIVLSVR